MCFSVYNRNFVKIKIETIRGEGEKQENESYYELDFILI